MPGVIAAAAAGGLLVGKVDGAVRRAARAAASASVLVEPVMGEKCSLPAKMVPQGQARRRFERSEVVLGRGIGCGVGHWSHSAAMDMEMSAALAEWVSAPTLMKSTPVSA